jgi:uncharacterized protein YrrD
MQEFPTNLRAGTDVYSSDGEKLGKLHRVVIKRSDLTLTHVVVDIGFLRSGRHLWEGGYGLDYDRIVPIDDLASVSDQRVDLTLTAQQFKDAPEYTEESFEQAQDLSPGEFDIADVVNRAEAISSIIGSTSNVWIVSRLNKPLDSADIVEGTPVWRREPHEKLGDVHRVLVNAETGRLQALVIARGFLLKHEVVLPARYISEVYDDLVHVELSDDEMAQLKPYNG